MKKLLLLLTILLSVTMSANSVDKIVEQSDEGIATVYKDGKDAVTTVYNDAKSIAPEIASNIKGIAKELKVGADHVWDILIKQQLVYSVCILFGLLLTIFSWIHFWYRYNEGHKNNWKSNKDWDGRYKSEKGYAYEISCIITCIIAVAGSIIVGIHFNTMITGFINPEFGAMKDIILFTSSLK